MAEVRNEVRKEYIDREAAKKILAQDYAYAAAELLDYLPTADVVEVVRCKECKIAEEDIMIDGWYYCNNNFQTHKPDHFCSYGEKKGGESNA